MDYVNNRPIIYDHSVQHEYSSISQYASHLKLSDQLTFIFKR